MGSAKSIKLTIDAIVSCMNINKIPLRINNHLLLFQEDFQFYLLAYREQYIRH